MGQLAPETRRLLPEVFRRIAVPYAGAFGSTGRGALASIVEIALAGGHVAPKHAVKIRLSSAAGESHARSNGSKGHLDEFAAAFGFLEEAGSNYISGKYAVVSALIGDLARRHRYFDAERAQIAIFLYALLERHGDCLLPYLILSRRGEATFPRFLELIRTSLQHKKTRFENAELPRNASFHEAVGALRRYAIEWGVDSAVRRTRREGAARPLREDKTLPGYFARTAAYCDDLGLTRRAGHTPTDLGQRLISAWESAANASLVPTAAEIPPSFEAIHDAFSVDWSKYARVFSPQITASTFEAVVQSTVLPHVARQGWRDADLFEDYAAIVSEVSEPLSGAARIDAVRLGLFTLGVGVGRPVDLADLPDNGGYDPNAQAAVALGLGNPRRFLLGHARSGRRFWTVAQIRR
jgi:hypothetical protein